MKIFNPTTSVLLAVLAASLARASSQSTPAENEGEQDLQKRINRVAVVANAIVPGRLTWLHYLLGATTLAGGAGLAYSIHKILDKPIRNITSSFSAMPNYPGYHRRDDDVQRFDLLLGLSNDVGGFAPHARRLAVVPTSEGALLYPVYVRKGR
ncbi:unnamed protein product [Tilletia laevis]|uniref:Uncharacterized protein n=3 Tax=Tilletia TaxID=13289 RepID=A0A8X7SVJ1_9BASI|nr:hypothetical protein CF328_g5302 [Tilletia controversa]KAE8193139.1 hypothetical protein CF336_g4126 [Tilletia laevis]KAE8256796.1 hypothetical protein A4X03_0g5048 [Tilletia caries]KAE8197513.1 hypothetical protein CF335_g4594 [Tilletia laevis]KAE8245183.1 hypothetical protein A4X06_0g5790 [Tilletia controversa]